MVDRRRFCVRGLVLSLFLCVLPVLPAFSQAQQELPLGSRMPGADMALPNVLGGQATLGALAGERGTAVIFWSNQCPWVERYEGRFISLVQDFQGRGIRFVLVNPNDVTAFPRESSEDGAERMRRVGYPDGVTYLSDSASSLAREFGAERTPHVFVFDGNRALVYVGAIDDSPGDAATASAHYLRDALQAVATGASVSVAQTRSFGCTIKFRN